MKFKILLIFALPLLVFFSSCEDPIVVGLDAATPELSVDGWIYSDTSYQEIKLTKTTEYFDTTRQPVVIGAQVSVTDLTDSTIYPYIETRPGLYTTNSFKPLIGRSYQLNIIQEGITWRAKTDVKRVPTIDSLNFELNEEGGGGGPGGPREKDTYFLTLFARETPGQGDYYKFDATLNGRPALSPDNINIIDDKFADGLVFIPPVNFPLNEKEYRLNDTVEVRILSINADAYAFWTEVNTQINNTSGLFAQIPTNVRTNIRNVTPGNGATAVGYFGGSGVSRKRRIVGQPQ
jgi:hypothetical protein